MEKVDIKALLKDPNNTFYQDDFDMFLTELELGGYDKTYVEECKNLIIGLRNKLRGKTDISYIDDSLPIEMIHSTIDTIDGSVDKNLSPYDRLKANLQTIRRADNYLEYFDKYVKDDETLDEKFIESCITLFNEDELDVLVKNIRFSEEFLEKHFSVLSKDSISEYQEFSEDFFIKHFNELNTKKVLNKGVNDWRLKANRSPKLEMFLRLKGIK